MNCEQRWEFIHFLPSTTLKKKNRELYEGRVMLCPYTLKATEVNTYTLECNSSDLAALTQVSPNNLKRENREQKYSPNASPDWHWSQKSSPSTTSLLLGFKLDDARKRGGFRCFARFRCQSLYIFFVCLLYFVVFFFFIFREFCCQEEAAVKMHYPATTAANIIISQEKWFEDRNIISVVKSLGVNSGISLTWKKGRFFFKIMNSAGKAKFWNSFWII